MRDLVTIPWKTLQRDATPLGQGSFGTVYRAEWAAISATVAVKQLPVATPVNALEQEAQLLSSLNSPYIIRLYGICTESPPALVMEYAAGGSLYNRSTVASRRCRGPSVGV